MKKIANIITTAKKTQFNGLFNVVKSSEECIDGLPTLVIGWKNIKAMFPDADILNKECHGIKWTFSKTERRCDYEDDIVSFYNESLLDAMSHIRYIYVDLINFKFGSIKKMIRFLKGNDRKIVFLTRDSRFIFVYCETYNTVFGISLSTIEYMGINKKKVIGLLKNCEFIHSTEFITSELRQIIGNNTHYILPLYDYFK